MSLVLGIDPDLDTTAYAAARDGRIECVGVVRVKKGRGLEGLVTELCAHMDNVPADLIVVEGQQIYQGMRQRPDDILRLAQFAGVAAGLAAAQSGCFRVLMPRPQEWKGSVPKPIHQARVLTRLGWAYEQKGPPPKRRAGKMEHAGYCVPTNVPRDVDLYDVRPSDWKHIVDAIGLALWGVDQIKNTAVRGGTLHG